MTRGSVRDQLLIRLTKPKRVPSAQGFVTFYWVSVDESTLTFIAHLEQ